MGDFNFPKINCEYHRAGPAQVRRFLKDLDDNLMEEDLGEPTQKNTLLGLLLVYREAPEGKVMV